MVKALKIVEVVFLNMEELAKALKELTYEHIVFFKRIDELTSVLNKDPFKAIEDFMFFLKIL
jgi:hypothetical protein